MRNLKNLFFVLGCACLFTAQAAVFKCDRVKDSSFLLALTRDSGLVFNNEPGFFNNLEGDVKVAIAADGGPTFVSLTSKEPVIDWANDNRCFVTGTSTRFSVKVSSKGDVGSTIQFFPIIFKNPNRSDCSFPEFRLAAPQPIKCKLLK